MRLPRPLPRLVGLATLVVLASTALAPSAALAAAPTYDSRDGGCTGTEGVTVIVDLDPTSDSAPAAPTHVRCVFGTPASGIDALERAGFDYETSDAFGDPFVCRIEGLPAACDPMGTGYWSYWKQDGAGWTFYDVGGFLARPVPGDVEGWRWVGDYMADPSSPPRVSPYAVRITDAPASALTSGATASFTFAVADAPDTTVLCRVDEGAWTACTSGTTHVVAGASVGSHAFAVRALDEFGNETFATRTFTVAPVLAPATVGSASASVASAHDATVSATVTAGGAAQQVHVEYTRGTDRATAARTAPVAVAAGATATPSFGITGLASNSSFAYRVVSVGSVGTVATEWATFTTPRVAVRLKVSTGDRFVARGERIVVRLDRLAPGETVTLSLGETEIGSAVADEDGEAADTVRIPVRTALGASAITAVGSGSDRSGRAGIVVTTAAELDVTTSSRATARTRTRATVTGLVSGEPVTLRWRGTEVASGTASRAGTFTAFVAVGARPGTYALIATGSHATRTGSATITVVTATSRRRG